MTVGQFELNGQLLMGPRAPSPACCVEVIWQKAVCVAHPCGRGRPRSPVKADISTPILNSKLTHYQNNLPLSDYLFTPL